MDNKEENCTGHRYSSAEYRRNKMRILIGDHIMDDMSLKTTIMEYAVKVNDAQLCDIFTVSMGDVAARKPKWMKIKTRYLEMLEADAKELKKQLDCEDLSFVMDSIASKVLEDTPQEMLQIVENGLEKDHYDLRRQKQISRSVPVKKRKHYPHFYNKQISEMDSELKSNRPNFEECIRDKYIDDAMVEKYSYLKSFPFKKSNLDERKRKAMKAFLHKHRAKAGCSKLCGLPPEILLCISDVDPQIKFQIFLYNKIIPCTHLPAISVRRITVEKKRSRKPPPFLQIQHYGIKELLLVLSMLLGAKGRQRSKIPSLVY